MTCDHGPRSVHFPGGQALLTANGNWTAIYDDHPGEVFQVWKCPGCSVELWGLAGEPTGHRQALGVPE